MPAADADRIESRRLIAFAMVFGMFMAILDVQIVSASLTEIQAGLAASSNEISWVQTAYLIAEVVMILLSGSVAGVGDAHPLPARRLVYGGEPDAGSTDQRDHRGGSYRLHRRRHDPHRFRHLVHDLSARAWA